MPRDLQYVYMAPGGDHCIAKDLLTPLHEQARCFKDMPCIAEQLPPGEQQPPSEKLVVHWYYMIHCSNQTKYVKSGKKLDDEMLDSLTGFFQALFVQKKANGLLEHASSITCTIG